MKWQKLKIPYIRSTNRLFDCVNDFDWRARCPQKMRVRLDMLVGVQPFVTVQGLLDLNWRRPIFVVRLGEKFYIRDGHHRVTRALSRGQKTINALVVEG